MPKNNFVTELVDAFNLCNYYFDDVNTNFTVKGNKIVGLFASDVEVKKYFQEVKKEIIKQHYGTEEAAGEYYNLNYFPFVFDVNSKWKAKERAIREVELADSTNNEVIRNLKIYFAKEFQRVVEAKVIKNLETSARMTKKKACECLEGSVLEEIDRYSPYLYCISFNDRYCEENRYPPRFFKAFRGMYISAFDLKLEEYGFNDSSIFYEQRDNKLYIKDITNIDVIKNVAKHVREQIALDFKTPGKEDSKVENLKDVLRDLIFKKVGKSINAYDYGVFIDKKQRKDGHSFALIPLEERRDGEFYSLGLIDAIKIDPNVLNLFKNSNISNVMGKVANPQFANCKGSVYAFSNKHIARLLPIIMESPIAYNERNGCFEFAVDLENFKRRGSSRSSSTVTSPTYAEPPRTPTKQKQEDRDSGYGSNSPPKPKDSVAHSPSGVPRSLFEQPQAQRSPTQSRDEELEGSSRQGYMEAPVVLPKTPLDVPGTSEEFPPRSHLSYTAVSRVVSGSSSLLQSVGAAQNVQAGTSDWSKPMNRWSSPAPSAEPSLWQPSRPSSWKGANPRAQPMSPGSSQSSNVITPPICYGIPRRPTLLTTKNDPKSSSPELSARFPGVEDVKSIFSVEPEKQQVTDKSVQGACGGSPEKKPDIIMKTWSRLSGRKSKESSPVSSPDGDGSIPGLSSQGTTVVESNSGLKSQKRLDPDQREELRPFLSPELQNKLNSNSFSPEEEQLLYLMYTLSGKRELRLILSPKEIEQLNLCKQSPLPQSEASSTKSPVKEIEARQLLLNGSKIDDSGYSSMPAPASPAVRRSEESSKERNISPVHSDVAGSQESLLEGCNVKQHIRSYLVERVWEAFEK